MPPLRDIPAHNPRRRGSPKKTTPPSAQKSGNLIDFDFDPTPGPIVSGSDNLPNPFQVESSAAINETRVTLRTEEEQQAAARERDEKERAELEKEISSRRDARRKSLANRRVSFAPEATLHTWDVVVEYQDSTTSSNSTNSTRRASSATTGTVGSGLLSSDPSEPPSTPPEQVEEDTATSSPAHQRDLHQKKRRRSSGIPPMNFNNPDEVFSSSPFSGDSDEDADEIVEDDGSLSNSDDDDNDSTMMSVDAAEDTNMSMASANSGESTGSSLEEALRLAARQAETQGMDYDEPAEAALPKDEEVVASFAPWSKRKSLANMESLKDQENLNPFSPAFRAGAIAAEKEEDLEGEDMTMEMTSAVGGILANQKPEDDEMSMDVTRAFGGIITNEAPKSAASKRKSLAFNRRQSTRRRSSGESSSMGDETMDLTMAIGGIQSPQDETLAKEDEDMSMEFTSAVGGLIQQSNPVLRTRKSLAPNQRTTQSRESIDSTAGDETMEMTVAVGNIVSSIQTSTPVENDETIGMDMTTAIGGILAPQRSTGTRSSGRKMMELETDFQNSPFQARVANRSPSKAAAVPHTIASETGSPSFAGFRGKGLRRSSGTRQSTTPKSQPPTHSTPSKKPTTPTKRMTPKPTRAPSPTKTPPSKNVSMRSASPKRLFKQAVESTTPEPASHKIATPNKLFQNDKTTGLATPSFILTPQPRRSSGIGLDKVGLGSPKVAALLDRRGSIGTHAKSFVPSGLDHASPAVHFADPRAIEAEIDKEREQEELRENQRRILEREADQGESEKDATLNLKEMIQSLTPKKKPLRGRKSLAVGGAKGLLGKRPAELDEDEDEDDNGGVKRLKNHQGSPVKNVKLQAPPTKIETTTGRMTRAARKSLDEAAASTTPTMANSPGKSKNTTPRHQGRFKDAAANNADLHIDQPIEKEPVENPEIDEDSLGDDRIQLQDFLNMTSIRFMELTTTKRRHTIAPKLESKGLGEDDKPVALEDCVAAGAATIPMLELFQHVSSRVFLSKVYI